MAEAASFLAALALAMVSRKAAEVFGGDCVEGSSDEASNAVAIGLDEFALLRSVLCLGTGNAMEFSPLSLGFSNPDRPDDAPRARRSGEADGFTGSLNNDSRR